MTKRVHNQSSGARWLALAVAVAITLTGGAIYGKYSQRWGRNADLEIAVKKLEKFPREIGNWIAVEDIPIERSALEMLECAGCVSRRYVNQSSGQAIQLAIMVGPPGPIAVHTPEVCFSSHAYEIQNERTEVRLEASPSRLHSFWRVDFTTRNAMADGLRVYYAWTDSHDWKASPSPRFEFAGSPQLCKLQLAAYFPPHLMDQDADPGRQFLEDFLQSTWASQVSGER